MARKITRKPASAVSPARRRDEEVVANFLLGALLILLVLVVYIPAFNAGFIWDDDQLLTSNPQVHSPDGWWTLWLKPETADYFPLTSTTLWIEYHLGELAQYFAPFSIWNIEYLQHYAAPNDVWGGAFNGYHMMNVLFHAASVLLTWRVLKKLRIPGAWLAAAIFAVHPVCVESVAWISERKNTLSQIFFLLSILYYLRFEEKGQLKIYAWAVAFFALSLVAKTAVVMLPFILLLLAWWRRSQIEPQRKSYDIEENPVERGTLAWGSVLSGIALGPTAVLVKVLAGFVGSTGINVAIGVAVAGVGGVAAYLIWRELRKAKFWSTFYGFQVIRVIPFLLAAFLLGLLTVYFQYGRAIAGEQIPIGNLLQRSISACFAAGFYLYSALWPFNIIEIYPQWHRAFWEYVTLPSPHWDHGAPEAIPYWKQAIPGVIIAGLFAWCLIRRTEKWARAILVAMGTYFLAMLPALGLLTMSYMRLTLVADHFQYISIIALIALIVAAGTTQSLKPVWLCGGAVYFAVVSWLNWSQTQDSLIGEFGQVLWIVGCLALAFAALQKNTWKPVWGAFITAVLLCASVMSFAQAQIYHSEKTLWSATLAKNPKSWQAHNHLGAALYMEGNWKAAYPHFLAATQLKPENPESHNNLGLALALYGRLDDAIHQYETAVSIKEDSAMETNLANAYAQANRPEDAIRIYKKAIAMGPGNASAHCNLGYMLMKEGRVDEAITEFIHTVELDPRMPQGWGDLLQAIRIRGINPDAPVLSGTYGFDVNEALELLKHRPPPPPPQQQPPQ